MSGPGSAAFVNAEVEFVLALGGYGLRLPGALLVTHEKIPAPRFNFVVVGRVTPQRQTAFFEKVLEHYFQRALRPRFRLPLPVEAHLDSGLRRLGFSPRPDPLVVLAETTGHVPPPPVREGVRTALTSELDSLAEFWASPKERPEFRTALDIAWHHPHPDEQMLPLVAVDPEGIVAAALVYRHETTAGIHLVGTRPSHRGQGAASAVVSHALRARPLGGSVTFSMFADSPRLVRRLQGLGFEQRAAFAEYELPPTAQLALPELGRPGPPRWRPPRGI